jgi:hypothetical protein
VCRSWIDCTFDKTSKQRQVNQVLGNLSLGRWEDKGDKGQYLQSAILGRQKLKVKFCRLIRSMEDKSFWLTFVSSF